MKINLTNDRDYDQAEVGVAWWEHHQASYIYLDLDTGMVQLEIGRQPISDRSVPGSVFDGRAREWELPPDADAQAIAHELRDPDSELCRLLTEQPDDVLDYIEHYLMSPVAVVDIWDFISDAYLAALGWSIDRLWRELGRPNDDEETVTAMLKLFARDAEDFYGQPAYPIRVWKAAEELAHRRASQE